MKDNENMSVLHRSALLRRLRLAVLTRTERLQIVIILARQEQDELIFQIIVNLLERAVAARKNPVGIDKGQLGFRNALGRISSDTEQIG